MNDTACRRLGYSRDELLRLSPRDIDTSDITAYIPDHVTRFEAEGAATWETWHRAKNGRKIPVEINAHRFELIGQAMILAEVRDLTERKQAEAALRQSEHRYRSLFANMMQGLIFCRVLYREGNAIDWVYLEVNEAFTTLTGVRNAAGLKITDRFPNIHESDPELLERYGRVARPFWGPTPRSRILSPARKTSRPTVYWRKSSVRRRKCRATRPAATLLF